PAISCCCTTVSIARSAPTADRPFGRWNTGFRAGRRRASTLFLSSAQRDVVTDQARTPPTLGARRASWPSARAVAVRIAFAVALLAGAVLVAALRIDAPEMPVARIVRKDVSVWISSNGQVEPSDPHVIVAGVDSFVRDVRVTPGTVVTRGHLLLTLDATE